MVHFDANNLNCIITHVSHLPGYERKSHTDHEQHEELSEPDVRGDVPVAHSGQGDDDKVDRLEHVERFVMAAALDVLYTADTEEVRGFCQMNFLL